MRVGVAFSVALAGCWTGKAPAVQPPPPPAEPTPSPATTSAAHDGPYRVATVTTDGIGIAATTLGLIGFHTNADEGLSGLLLVSGLVISMVGSPLMHLANDHAVRATESIIGRTVVATVGVSVGAIASGCFNKDDFCSFEPAMWGMAAGFAVASIADAFLLHGALDKHAATPTILPSDHGAQVGVAARF